MKREALLFQLAMKSSLSLACAEILVDFLLIESDVVLYDWLRDFNPLRKNVLSLRYLLMNFELTGVAIFSLRVALTQ